VELNLHCSSCGHYLAYTMQDFTGGISIRVIPCRCLPKISQEFLSQIKLFTQRLEVQVENIKETGDAKTRPASPFSE